ncbi:hypothetical protein AB3M83_03715 [Microbacterium sp. 179-B 1A2 NHS]|uniref:hypothetical protein n=1 Tax=Microbacterium sp. 179-B 1A2 NHS TaxID=3142383 RepID=UPI0039A2D204
MKRIEINYGGELYSVGERTVEEITAEIRTAIESGHGWIQVNNGEGAPRPARLLVTAGVPIALIPIPDTASTDDHVPFSPS